MVVVKLGRKRLSQCIHNQYSEFYVRVKDPGFKR